MKLNALKHPKTLDFAARLSVELPTALGHLELLWAFTGEHAAQGNIGKWPDGAIARACYWMGRPELFTQALLEARLIDADDEHRLTVHDWREHAPGWVRAKLKKLDLDFIPSAAGTPEPSLEPSSESSLEPSTKGREVKGSEGKPREEKPREESAPAGLDSTAWANWVDYRVKIRKPLKQVSMPAAQQQLAAFGSDQAAVVQQSIANGWQGLFALKHNGHDHAKPATSRFDKLRGQRQ